MDYSIYCDKLPQAGETIYGKQRFVQPGGKGANQCIALAKSKMVDVSFVGARGCDAEGEYIEDLLKENNVNTHIEKVEGVSTGNATILIDEKGENRIIIIKGANAELKPSETLSELIKETDMVVLQNEIPISTNEWIIKTAHNLGKTIVYNPAPFCQISSNIYAKIDYFIVNEVELAQYTGVMDFDLSIKKLLSLGAKNIIVTLGENGSAFYNKNMELKIDAYKTKVVDTVSAGDTFVGYFAASILSDRDIETSMRISNAASSITVSRKGSMKSIPSMDEVSKIYKF